MNVRSHILVVDDDPMHRLLLSDILEEHGLVPLTAASADEAIGILGTRSDVAMVITDVVMPGSLDGLGLISQLRRRWPHIPAIVTSGRMPEAAAGNAPATTFLEKPFDADALIAAIERQKASLV